MNRLIIASIIFCVLIFSTAGTAYGQKNAVVLPNPYPDPDFNAGLLSQQLDKIILGDSITQNDIDSAFNILVEDCSKAEPDHYTLIYVCQKYYHALLQSELEDLTSMDMIDDVPLYEPPQLNVPSSSYWKGSK